MSRQKLPRTVFRPLDGILLLDKPAGLSSNQALQRVRHLFRAEKAGHTGSLDPLATGLLPVCFGEATKIAGHLLGNSKAYETVAKLGVTTDTDDADGLTLRERDVPTLTAAQLAQAIRPLTGRISQRPP
ncbi:MAG TPA: tRNA pseudouridine(55) synthase TruB, partial [Luteimonas sp.]|nr:tRNA pseudouridine(55) synthase TruB [Luteimonas sp.]